MCENPRKIGEIKIEFDFGNNTYTASKKNPGALR
jgi:hypothetical protein